MAEPTSPAGPDGLAIAVAGELVTLCAERAAWWPARRTLLVADLHLGKEETFLHFGVPMPATVLEETLERLGRLAAAGPVRRIVVVGDLVHARAGLSSAVVDRVARWRRSFPGSVELVAGNHDRCVAAMPASWGIEPLAEEVLDGPFAYRHEPPVDDGPRDDGRLVWCGHLHPTVRIAGGIALPAFLVGRSRAVLPAFTAFARGPGVAVGPHDRVFAAASGQVVEVATTSAGRGR